MAKNKSIRKHFDINKKTNGYTYLTLKDSGAICGIYSDHKSKKSGKIVTGEEKAKRSLHVVAKKLKLR